MAAEGGVSVSLKGQMRVASICIVAYSSERLEISVSTNAAGTIAYANIK